MSAYREDLLQKDSEVLGMVENVDDDGGKAMAFDFTAGGEAASVAAGEDLNVLKGEDRALDMNMELKEFDDKKFEPTFAAYSFGEYPGR